MLEESRMDKMNRSSLQQSRLHAVDNKKGAEITHKPWPRNNKKREGSSNTPKNEPSRKNVPPQRGRGQMDKRPHTRGASNFNMGRMENTGIEDEEPEIGSVFVPGSKKQNLNHLLNFVYPSRGGTDRRCPAPRRQNYQRVSFKHQHDLYLRAYCQFVVNKKGDYKANLIDPDMPIKWEQIEEIVVRSSGKSECPICLGSPVAGRVGVCGHVYCWACVLHYNATHDKQPPPCPVCATPLRVEDMKPAAVVQWEAPADEVTMRLVRRLRGSTVVEEAPARGQSVDSAEAFILPLTNHKEAPFAKIFTATKEQIMDILERDRKEIQDQILAEIDTTEIEYLEQALAMLKVKEEKINKFYIESTDDVAVSEEAVRVIYEKPTVNEKKVDWFDITDEATGVEVNEKDMNNLDIQCSTNGATGVEVIENNINNLNIQCSTHGATGVEVIEKNMNNLDIQCSTHGATGVEVIEENMNKLALQCSLNPEAKEFHFDCPDEKELDFDKTDVEFPLTECPGTSEVIDETNFVDIDKQNQAKYFYFYQADDGQQVFLNRLNVRMLNASWGSLVAAPPIIHGRVLHRETHFLTEETRNHMPCTAHLPLHCAFDIVEIELKPPNVSAEVLQNYTDELERRARKRAKHELEERRRERAYRRAMEGPPKPDFSSDVLFPPTYGSPPTREPVFEQSPSTSASPLVEQSSSVLSFAKMASASGTWRVRKSPISPVIIPTPTEEDTSAPRSLMLADAIEAALHATPPTPVSTSNKKKKFKKLFTTDMQRAS